MFSESSDKKPSGSKKSKDKKKQVVGIRKRVVSKENPESGVLVKESILVRVDSSSNETGEGYSKESSGELSDGSESTINEVNTSLDKVNKSRKPRKSDQMKLVIKSSEVPAETPEEPSINDTKLRRRSGRGITSSSFTTDEEEVKKMSVSKANLPSTSAVVDEDDLPLKKFTRSRNSSPQKVPVMRIDRSAPNSGDKSQPQSSPSASTVNSRQSTGKVNTPRKTGSDAVDDEGGYDTDEFFEELLDKMEPDEIKKLDYLSQVLEGEGSESSDDDLPLVTKQKVNKDNYSSDDDLPLKPKSVTMTIPSEKSRIENPNEESSQKKSTKKKSAGTPIKVLQEIATSMAESLSDLQSSMNKTKGKSKKGKHNEEEVPMSSEVSTVSAPPIKVIVKVPRGKNTFTTTEPVEEDISPSRRKTLRSREPEELQSVIEATESRHGRRKAKEADTDHDSEVELASKSSKKRPKIDLSNSSEQESKELPETQLNSISKDEAQSLGKTFKKRNKQVLDVSVESNPPQEIGESCTSDSQVIQEDTSDDLKRNSEHSRSKKRTKTSSLAPIPLPPPNPETVNELDPNLIGELTPRLSRKRFKELSSTTTAVESPKLNSETSETASPNLAPKVSKKKSKTRVSDALVEITPETLASDVASKSSKNKLKTQRNPSDSPPEVAGSFAPKLKKKTKGRADENEDEEIESSVGKEGHSNLISVRDKSKTKRDVESSPETEVKLFSKFGKRKTKGGSAMDDSLEDISANSTSAKRGKRPKLDESLVDSADNDSITTGSDFSEFSRSSRRSKLRGADNSADLSETESTTTSIDVESLSGCSKVKTKAGKEEEKDKRKNSKRKAKGQDDNAPDVAEENQDDQKEADSSLDESLPSAKRQKKGIESSESTKEQSTTYEHDNVNEVSNNTITEDSQVSSEAAVVPAANVTQNPPVAASPTPAESPESTSKQRKSSKGSKYFCWVCQRPYSTAFNLHKHFASAYHKSNVDTLAKEDVEKAKTLEDKTESIDLPKSLTEEKQQPHLTENSQKSHSENVADACCQTSEEDMSIEQAAEKPTEMQKSNEMEKSSGAGGNASVPQQLDNLNCVHASSDPAASAPDTPTPVSSKLDPLVAVSVETECQNNKENQADFGLEKSTLNALSLNHDASQKEGPHSDSKELTANRDNIGAKQAVVSEEQQSFNQTQHYSQPQYDQQQYDQNHYQQHYDQTSYHDQGTQPNAHYGQAQHYNQQQPNQHYSQHVNQQQQSNQTYHHRQEQTQPQQPNHVFENHQQQPANQHYGQQQPPQQQQQVPQQSNQMYDQQQQTQPQQQQQQSYNTYNNSSSWQSSDSSWGPWRIPEIAPTFSSEEGSGGLGLGLGSILDSVNQVLSGDGGMSDPLPMYADYATLTDLQQAIGANDEEMAVLRQLGEGSLRELIGPPPQGAPTEEADLLDLDNQKKATERSAPSPSTSSEPTTQTCRVSPFISSTRPSARSSQSSASSGTGKLLNFLFFGGLLSIFASIVASMFILFGFRFNLFFIKFTCPA